MLRSSIKWAPASVSEEPGSSLRRPPHDAVAFDHIDGSSRAVSVARILVRRLLLLTGKPQMGGQLLKTGHSTC